MNQERLMTILLSPRTSEKTYQVSEQGNHVVFAVRTDSDKREIKKAVELLFEVEVENVKTVNVKGKSRRFGKHQGQTSDWKKAYVKLKPGHDINFGDAE